MNLPHPPVFTAIGSRRMAADQIVEHLHDGLRAGRFKAGEVFSIGALTEAYGVSRTPVREALARLVAEGVLEDDARGQVRVPQISRVEFERLSLARCVVEGAAAGQAALLCPEVELATLAHLAERHRSAFNRGAIAEILTANADFHFAIYAHSQNEFLVSTAKRLWLRAGPYTLLASRMLKERIATPGLDLYSPYHDDVLAAIAARDEPRARDAMVADIQRALELVRPYLDVGAS